MWFVLLALVSCSLPGDAAPVVKIGLIAPFEGLGRPLGYAVLPEVQEVLAAANASAELGRYRVALVALNDDMDPAAATRQARALVVDGDVLGVIGPFSQATAEAAAPVLAQAGLATLAAAPMEGVGGSVLSLCPRPSEIAAALEEGAASLASQAGGAAMVLFPADASAAADRLVEAQASSVAQPLVGGPDVLRSWFVQRAGAAAEGSRAVACVTSGEAAQSFLPAEGPVVTLARAAAETLLSALSADVRAHDVPTRAGVAAELGGRSPAPQLRWYRVADAAWAPLP